MTRLTAEAVQAIARASLFKPDELQGGEPPANAIIVDGLVHKFAFHPERVMAAKPKIDELLSELPDEFQRTKNAGWTFLNACRDRYGYQWGEHRDIEVLICLGIAVGSATWLMKEIAESLPGGVPYLEVHPGPHT